MVDTPNLKLPYILAAQSQKHVTHNEAIRTLDAIVQLNILDRNLATPPASPNEGDRYLVDSGATGAWAGQSGKIAAFQDGTWIFHTPKEGWLAWIADENVALAYDGGTWLGFSGSGGGVSDHGALTGLADDDHPQYHTNARGDARYTPINPSTLGINATADTTNRLALSSAATLLNHAGAGHQVKVNKNAAADTASFLFQTGFSGRAEMGTTGDDSFHFKVSPDGTTWKEALVIDKTTGACAFPFTTFGGVSDGDKGDVVVSGGGTVWSLDSAVTSSINARVRHVANRTALKALATTEQAAILDEAGREGLFEWDASIPIATHQADTKELRYVAPNAAAVGAWVRKSLPHLHLGGDTQLIEGRENLAAWYKGLKDKHAALPTLTTRCTGFLVGDSKPAGTVVSAAYQPLSILSKAAPDRGFPVAQFLSVAAAGSNTKYVQLDQRPSMMANPDWVNTSLVIYDAGTNDNSTAVTYGAQTLAQTEQNLKDFIDAVRNTGASPAGRSPDDLSILILGQTTAGTGTSPNFWDEQLMRDLSALYRRVAREKNCCFLDCFALFRRATSEAGWMDSSVHPLETFNAALYSVITDLIMPPALSATAGTGHLSREVLFNAPAATALPSTYARGRTLAKTTTGGGWPYDGIVETVRYGTNHATQFHVQGSGGGLQYRSCNGVTDAWSSWTNVASGGGGSPGGASTQLQFNNSGSFGGVPAATFNSGTNELTFTQSAVSTPQAIFANTAANGYAQVRFDGTGRDWQIGVGNAGEALFGVADEFYIFDATANLMRIAVDASGRVGIGTTTPTAKLHVGGTSGVDGIKFPDGSLQTTAAVSLGDGDKGDVTVSGSGATWTIDNDAVTYAKIQNVTAADRLLGRVTAGAGDIEEITCTAAGRALLDDADAATQRATLGLGSAATQASTAFQTADATLTALAAFNTNGLLVQTAADTFAGRSLSAPAAGLTITNPAGTAGNPTFALANDLAALEGLAGTGLAARTAADTWAQRTITGPAAGITVANGDGVAGNPTLALANDLAAVEGLSATGLIRRTAADTWSAGTQVATAEIANNAVDNTKLAQITTATFKGRTTAGTGNVEDLTATQATALLNAVVGDAGSGGSKGLVPAPAAGDAAAGRFLKADGTWTVPPGGGGGSPGGSSGQLQFNNAGAFGGVGALSFNSGTNELIFTQSAVSTPQAIFANTAATGYAQIRFDGTGRDWQIGVGNAGETLFGVADDFYIFDATANLMRVAVDASGRVGIGTMAPSAMLHLPAGSATIAPAKMTGGTNLTTAESGASEFDGKCFYDTAVASSRQLRDTEQFITLTTAYTLTSQTAAQKLFNATANGAVTVQADTTYFFECYFSLSSLSATSGAFGFALGGTATLTAQRWRSEAVKAALATASTALITDNIAANATIVTANTTTTGHARITGKIRVNAGGTLIPQVSLGVAAAAIVGVDSFFRIWPAGAGTVTSVGNWS